MRQSFLFTKTRHDAPADEVARSAQLLLRAGFVTKEVAGAYDLLPLGLRVLNKIITVIRREMNAIDGQEVALTALQDPELWKTTDRWDDTKVDTWFKTRLKNDSELGLAFTHEEALTRIMKNFVGSYRDLPKFVYQFQTKFRNELRAKSGLLRGREFLMKDLYSFSRTVDGLNVYYERAAEAYLKIFRAVGLGDVTVRTFANGGVFSKYSDEFQAICPTGEDTIYVAREQGIGVNQEVYNDHVLADLGLKKDELEEVKAIEVGNIFKLGTRFSEPLGLTYTDEQGKQRPVVMGSYGIGVGRLLATIVEVLADDRGMVWPATVAPFAVHIIELNPKSTGGVTSAVTELVAQLEARGLDVLHDDRELTPGQKFADSDLIGIPTRVVISDKTVAVGTFEVKHRSTGVVEHLPGNELLGTLTAATQVA